MGKLIKSRSPSRVSIIITAIALISLGCQHLIVQHNSETLGDSSIRNEQQQSSNSALPIETLRLNTDTDLECPRILILRTPKTASSSLADILHQRLNSGGATCDRTYLPAHRFMDPGKYTLTEQVLDRIPKDQLSRYSAFCAHMNYSPQLRNILKVDELYRVATIRQGEARAISLVAYEEKRIGRVPMRPMLEYLGAPRLKSAVALSERLTMNISEAAIGKQVEAALNHFNLIVVAEMWEESLAVLMHDLNLRLVDLLLPRVNVQSDAKKMAAFKRVQDKWNDQRLEYFKWMVNVDTELHKRAELTLRQKFAALPIEYQKVPEALRILQPLLTQACPTDPSEKHFKMKEVKCIRKFRQRMLNEAGVDGPVGELY